MKLILALTLAAGAIFAQQLEDKSTEHKSFSGVHDLLIDNVSGFIEVTASNGGNVEMDIERTIGGWSPERIALGKKELSVHFQQDGGLLRAEIDGPFRCHCGNDSIGFHGDSPYSFSYDFKIRVPRDMKLELRTVNKSHVTVEGTSGDFKIRNVNGPIEMKDIEGSGSVNTVNGPVKVTFRRNPSGATSFKSVNGTLDVTFRAGLNADVKMKTLNGGLYTDFNVSALPNSSMPAETVNGKLVWRSNRMTGVRIGSGGPELQFETVNGDVLIKNRER